MKEAMREEAMAEYLKEKDQVQELVDKIAKEDREEFEAREAKKAESRAMLQPFMKEQKANHIAEFMENERLQHVELEHKLNIEKGKQRERVKHINQQQIAMKEAMREEAMAEYLKEKDQVQELVEKIAKEDH